MVQSETNQVVDPRFDREGDWEVQHLISEADRQLSPEEYAARNAHLWLCFSYHRFRYQDPALGKWVKRVGELLSDKKELDRYRAMFLTTEEIDEIHRDEAEGFD